MIAILTTRHGQGLGAEAVLEQCLRGWQPSYPELTVVTPPGSKIHDVATELGLPLVELQTKTESLLENLRAVRRLHSHLSHCTLVHGWTARAMEPALMLAHKLGLPATATLHDHPCADFLSGPRQKLLRWSAGKLTSLVCVSDAVRQACRQHGFPENLEVIHNGLTDLALKKTHSDKVRIGFLGMYAEWKGFLLVADWIEQIPTPAVEWHLYGDVFPGYLVRARHIEQSMDGRVNLHGRQNPERIFTDLDLLVHASTAFDPLPTVLLEATRAGIPVVASSLGGASEIVEEGHTGFLFDPQNPDLGRISLQRLVEDDAQRTAMGTAARTRYEKFFTVTRMACAYAEYWRNIAGPSRHEQL